MAKLNYMNLVLEYVANSIAQFQSTQGLCQQRKGGFDWLRKEKL